MIMVSYSLPRTPLILTCVDVFFGAWKYLHCWTMSRPLWEALSSFDFFRRWKTYHIIRNFEFENFLKTGRADDVDDFSKVLMVG
jgi:hypothetical protein